MPRRPKGQKRPADVIGAIRVAKIAAGEIAEDVPSDGKGQAAQSLGRRGGKAEREGAGPKEAQRDRTRGSQKEVVG